MKEITFTKTPHMNASERRIADLHSVFNILNILVCELSLVEPDDETLISRHAKIDGELFEISRQMKDGGDLVELLKRIRDSGPTALDFVREAGAREDDRGRKDEIGEILGNLESVYTILGERLNELEVRMDDPDVWIQIELDDFRRQFKEVFVAIAKNSKGRYQVHFNLARKRDEDYYIDLRVETIGENQPLWIPLRMIDILRDLTANARKYTKPGGKVALAVYQDEESISAVIEDSGCGIPDDELERVAEFGYRGSNVRDQASFGGGYGLTKAVWLVTSWGGSLTIQSDLNKGTTIRVDVPNIPRLEGVQPWPRAISKEGQRSMA